MAAQQPQQGQPRQPRQPQQQQYGPAYAGLGGRAIALIIDTILVGIVGGIIGVALVGAQGLQLVTGLLSLVYFIGMEGANDGQTVGKMAMGIKVTTEGGGEIDIVASAIRNILRIIDALPFLYIIGIIMVSVNDENKRVGDIGASTIVVDADAVPAGGAQQGGQQQYQQGGQQQYQQGGQQQGGWNQGGQQQGGQQQGGQQQGGWNQGGQQGNQQDDGWS